MDNNNMFNFSDCIFINFNDYKIFKYKRKIRLNELNDDFVQH